MMAVWGPLLFPPQFQFYVASFLQPLFHEFGSVLDRQLKIAVLKHRPQILQRQQIDGKAEQRLLQIACLYSPSS
jgi:hypothetical protein